MKSDNTWDLGTEGGQQRLLIPTAGVTAAYAEKAHKVTLNASSDIFARCSNSRIQAFATRRDENREAAPRPRHSGVLNRTHTVTRASSLAKMSAGITNPCGYID